MGRQHEFTCPACGYAVTVSGGDDAGMNVITTTLLCETCKTLEDVVVHQLKPERIREPRCPRSPRHKVRRWVFPDVCPKCGTTMELGEVETIWD